MLKYIEMEAIINKGEEYGTLDGIFLLNSHIMEIIVPYIKAGKAKLVIDNDKTLMYITTK